MVPLCCDVVTLTNLDSKPLLEFFVELNDLAGSFESITLAQESEVNRIRELIP